MTCMWTTRLDPQFTRLFGVEELHKVCFEPADWPGQGPCITLEIPECKLLFAFPTDGEPVAFINQPQRNHDIKRWSRFPCKLATQYRAFLFFSCNTREQAERAAERATRWLRHHRRAALERLTDPQFRRRRNLS